MMMMNIPASNRPPSAIAMMGMMNRLPADVWVVSVLCWAVSGL